MGPLRRTVAIALGAILVAGACSGTASPAPSGATTPTVIAGSPLPPGETPSPGGTPSPTAAGTPGPGPSEPPAEPPATSEELIAQALAAGEIDYETSLLYRAYAVFGDPRLPRQYGTDVVDIGAGTFLMAEIEANRARLSAGTLAALRPFTARPNDPGSFFNQDLSGTSDGLPAAPTQQTPTWESEPAAGGLARVWTRSDYPTAFTLPSGYADLVSDIWPKVVALMGRSARPDLKGVPTDEINPDPAIDIYILPVGETSPRDTACQVLPQGCTVLGSEGMTKVADPVGSKTASGYVLISASERGDELVATIAHELAHIVQYNYDWREPSKFLADATADWVAFRVLQQLGRSTADLYFLSSAFFGCLDYCPLDSDSPFVRYGAYIYFVHAQMVRGDGIVKAVWEEAVAKDGIRALDAAFSLSGSNNFRRFALRNWNFDPVPPSERYESADREFPPELHPPLEEPDRTLSPANKETLDKEVKRLTARYYRIVVPKDAGIQKVKIKLDDVTGKDTAGVWALLTIEGKKADYEDWSAESEKTYCLDDPDQQLRELVLIVSNASLSDPLDGRIEIDPTQPCAEWTGTITVSDTGSYLKKTHVELSGTNWTATWDEEVTVERHDEWSARVGLDWSEESGGFEAAAGSLVIRNRNDRSTVTVEVIDDVVGGGTCRHTEVSSEQVSETYPLPDTRAVADWIPIRFVLDVYDDQWELRADGLGEAGTHQTRIDDAREGYPPESVYCLQHETRSGKVVWLIQLEASGTLTSEGSISYTDDFICPAASPPTDPGIVAYQESCEGYVSISLTRHEKDH